MEWRTRSRQGRVAAGPSVPRRERRLPRHLRRASASNAGAHARRPQTPPCVMTGERPASSASKQGAPRPQAGHASWPGPDAPAGPCRRAGRAFAHACRRRSARGAQGRKCRALRSRAGRTCGTERVISPAPLPGALRGVPARRGGRRQALAPAQGKAFPHRSRYEFRDSGMHRQRPMQPRTSPDAAQTHSQSAKCLDRPRPRINR